MIRVLFVYRRIYGIKKRDIFQQSSETLCGEAFQPKSLRNKKPR